MGGESRQERKIRKKEFDIRISRTSKALVKADPDCSPTRKFGPGRREIKQMERDIKQAHRSGLFS